MLTHFRSIEELTKTLSREQSLLGEMFEKRKLMKFPLGVAIEIPKGYEAIVVPRSSTYSRYGIIQTNSIGVIDESYCGDGDEWKLPAYAMRGTDIPKDTRIAQFRIIKHQPEFEIEVVSELGNENRGGFGSTGTH